MRRREFLTLLGLGGVAQAALPGVAQALPRVYGGHPDAVGVLHDSVRCIGCRECEAACQKVNAAVLPPPAKPFTDMSVLDAPRRPTIRAYTVVNRYAAKASGRPLYRKLQCNHCQEPVCASACFVKALVKTEEGPVTYDPGLCVGCRYCMMVCPYYVPAYDYHSALNPLVYKCTLCAPRLKKGLLPGCVEACPKEALVFDKRSTLIRLARRRIMDNPGLYVDHIYGEREMGGTNWLYLSPVPHQELGQPELAETSVPELTRGMFGAIAMIAGIWPVALGGAYSLSKHYKKQIARAREEGGRQADDNGEGGGSC